MFDIEFFTKLEAAVHAFDIQFPHHGVRFGIIPAMNDRRIRTRRPHRDVIFLLDQRDAKLVLRELIGDGATDDARPDYRHIKHAFAPSIFSFSLRDTDRGD